MNLKTAEPNREPQVDTVCRAIYALIDRSYQDGSHQRYEDMILRLANIAMHATDAFNPFILALDERLDQCDYAGALLIARAMVQQEDVLLGAAQGISKMSSNKLQ